MRLIRCFSFGKVSNSRAIMATLVVYCLKSVPASALQDNLILFAGVAVTAAVHIWKKSSILSITVGTVVYMVLVHLA